VLLEHNMKILFYPYHLLPMYIYIWHANYGEIFCDIFPGFSIAGFKWNFDAINWA